MTRIPLGWKPVQLEDDVITMWADERQTAVEFFRTTNEY